MKNKFVLGDLMGFGLVSGGTPLYALQGTHLVHQHMYVRLKQARTRERIL